MEEKTASVYVWSIVTFISILIFKDYLLGGYQQQLYFNLATDCLLIIIVFILSIKRRSSLLNWIQFIMVFSMIFYHWLDSCIFMAIQNRLTMNNFIGNIQYANVIIYFISTKIIIFTIAVVSMIILLRKKIITLPLNASTINLISFEILFLVAIAYFVINSKFSPYNEGNAINLATTSYIATSVTNETLSFINNNFNRLIYTIKDYLNGNSIAVKAENHNVEKPNIIIVVSESLSMVDSKYAGGLFNRLPMIDKLQQDGLVFEHAVSNGKITSHGLSAFILGAQATKTGGYVGMLDQFPPDKFSGNNIIKYAKELGYETILISPGGSANFHQMIPWFKAVGFDKIYDVDSEIFSAAPRFTWDAPSDEAMYQAAINMLPDLKKPYFLVIETVSLHQPYILPDLKYHVTDNDLLNQINYVDRTTFEFYQNLKKVDFFGNGLFILFGDHRRFEPLENPELESGGYSVWHERIICSIVGKGIASRSKTTIPFSLVDMNTLLHYIVKGYPVNERTMLNATLSTQLGIETPFSVSLVDDDHGTYLLRFEKYAPLYISIYGPIPFDKIYNLVHKKIMVYLIENDQQVNSKVTAKRRKKTEEQIETVN